MQIHTNVLNHELLQYCVDELYDLSSKNQWMVSSLIWPSDLKNGIIGNCLVTFPSEETIKLLKKEISGLLPKHGDLIFLYYIWTSLSGINWHDDVSHKFGATLYLNKEWDRDWGGLFMWQDDDYQTHNICKTIVPSYNMMIVNDTKQDHAVTPVSTAAPTFRCTLQIWGLP